jgi:hypothetical protein
MSEKAWPQTAEAEVKGRIFFSHASEDAVVLGELKAYLQRKFNNTIDVFLSPQSIGLAEEWKDSLERGLQGSRLMLCFLSESSFRSIWIHFEVGFALASKSHCKIVPVGIKGFDVRRLKEPVSWFQGVNLRSRSDLELLFRRINAEFNWSHPWKVSQPDFLRVFKGWTPDWHRFVRSISISCPFVPTVLEELRKDAASATIPSHPGGFRNGEIDFWVDHLTDSGGCLHIEIARTVLSEDLLQRLELLLDRLASPGEKTIRIALSQLCAIDEHRAGADWLIEHHHYSSSGGRLDAGNFAFRIKPELATHSASVEMWSQEQRVCYLIRELIVTLIQDQVLMARSP